MKNNLKPKQLNLNPLSVAKFFYENLGERALDPAFIQPTIYLCYKEIEKKENLLLFAEEFEDSEYTPYLTSLDKLIENEKQLLRKFNKVEDITNPLVTKHLKNFAQKYNDTFACELQFKARNSGGRRVEVR